MRKAIWAIAVLASGMALNLAADFATEFQAAEKPYKESKYAEAQAAFNKFRAR